MHAGRKSRTLLAVAAITTAVVCSPAFARMQSSPPVSDPLGEGWRRISLQPVSIMYGLNEPVLANLRVTNLGDESAVFDLGGDDKENLSVTIKTPGGVSKTVALPIGGLHSPGKHLVGAHSTYTQRLVLNEWDDFRQVGDYFVEIALIPKAGPKPDRPLTAYLHVNIGPRDEGKLRVLAKTLANEALDRRDRGDRDTAALALSYVTDPVAIPDMVRVLQSNRALRKPLVWALVRVGGPVALNAVETARQSSDPTVHYDADEALRALRDGRALVPLPAVD